jgi:Periplasmic copper-binding protein (NosD)/WD40-like Beta Propeller Repeat
MDRKLPFSHAAFVVAAVAVIAIAGAAQAAFPGEPGRIAFFSNRSGNFDIFTVKQNGKDVVQLTTDPGVDQFPSWSADGSKIVFTSNRDGNAEVYVMSADGSGQTRVSYNTVFDENPVFSPDASQITFASNRDGNFEVYVMDADGSNVARLTTNSALDRFPMFSPDGSKIIFTSGRDGNTELYTMNPDGSDQIRLTNRPGGDSQANYSPDGSRIAWRCSPVEHPEIGDICAMNADGTDQTQLTDDPADDLRPAWSPSGAKIAFRSLRTNQGDIYVMKADGTHEEQLTDDPSFDAYPDWQPLAEEQGAATGPATLVVDDDASQCASADFTSIQRAVDAAQPGDLIRVCAGLYPENVTINKPLALKADPDTIEAIDCFQPTLPELPTNNHAIVDPAGEGFSIGVRLAADDVVLEGFVLQGAAVGIDASDRYSGYRIHHNLIRGSTLFAFDFGSAGARESRVDHNCIRDNLWGLVSELDDDSRWPDRENRGPGNARDLFNARIDHNATFRNSAGLEAAGPGGHDRLTFDHNVSREDGWGIQIQNSEQSRIIENDVRPTRNGIVAGGATTGLVIASNTVTTGRQGIVFVPASFFIDRFPAPIVDALVAENVVTGQVLDGIVAGTDPQVGGRLQQSYLVDNVTSDNVRDGIVLRLGNSGNVIRGNAAERNGEYGVYAQGATQNMFEVNRMLGNGVVDARDENRTANTWIANQCMTDFPTGTICRIG